MQKKRKIRTDQINKLNNSLNNYDNNNFVKFLYSKFDSDKVTELLGKYKIGTTLNEFHGTLFWQIDIEQKIRGGKIISYDQYGKRTKYINRKCILV